MNKLIFQVFKAGSLKNPLEDYYDKTGVYFWAHNSEIIYVGTTNESFRKRVGGYYKEFLAGKKTIWITTHDDFKSVYDLMREKQKENIDFLKNKVWIPSNSKSEWSQWLPKNKRGLSLTKFKGMFNIDDYLDQLRLFFIPLENNNRFYKNYIECLESFIQMSLYDSFELFNIYNGSIDEVNKNTRFGVLGKQEKSLAQIKNTFGSVNRIILNGLEGEVTNDTHKLFSDTEENGYEKLNRL